MNHALKPFFAAFDAGPLPLYAAVSLFHSTHIMERKRRPSSDYGRGTSQGRGLYRSKRFHVYAKRIKRIESKRSLLKDVSEYAEYLFQSWKDDDNIVWFRRPYWSKGARLNGFSSCESQSGKCKNKRKEGFHFCTSDDDDVENIFGRAFGGERYYYWNSSTGGNFHWRCSSDHSHKASSDWSDKSDSETDEDTVADNCAQSVLTSERLALGLSASGPLKLAEIKSAYRVCALRWHPDRHQGTSKVMAEEKFKHCSTAYKSLCDKLASS